MVRPVEAGEVAKRRDAMLAAHKNRAAAVGTNAIAASSQIDPSVFIASTARVRGRLIEDSGELIPIEAPQALVACLKEFASADALPPR